MVWNEAMKGRSGMRTLLGQSCLSMGAIGASEQVVHSFANVGRLLLHHLRTNKTHIHSPCSEAFVQTRKEKNRGRRDAQWFP